MAKTYTIPKLPLGIDLETKEILKQVNLANKALAELKGVAHTIPNEGVLINSNLFSAQNRQRYYWKGWCNEYGEEESNKQQ